jgi:hypothetical protein
MNSGVVYTPSTYVLEYSTDETIANVIISTYGILVKQNTTGWIASKECLASYEVTIETGPTREIAAMQCFAVSRLGETVDIPDELLF